MNNDSFALLPGERLLFRGTRGGNAGRGGCFWVIAIFVGLQLSGAVFGLIAGLSMGWSGGSALSGRSAITLAVATLCGYGWLRFQKTPACLLTDRRLIVPRFLRTPLIAAVSDIGAAARFKIHFQRYGRTVRTDVTDRIVVGIAGASAVKLGPLREAADLEPLLQAIGQRWIDPRSLPGLDGSLARAEERGDLFLALTCTIQGAPRGPVFVGPARMVAFYNPMPTLRAYQLLSICGADRSALDVEDGVVALAANREWGHSVVMERNGRKLMMIGDDLTLASGDQHVAFTLGTADADRARQFTKGSGGPFR